MTDYEAVPMQIGFLHYPEIHHSPRRAYTFLILRGCFFSSVLSATLSRGSVCLILVVCFAPLLSAVTPFGLERDFVLVQCGYLHLIVKWVRLGGHLF